MLLLSSVLIVAIVTHVSWFLRRRASRFPAIGTKWGYGTYMKRYVAEVVDHHPLTNEVTVVRTEEDNPFSGRTYLRVDPAKFMSMVTPYKEKR